MKQDLDLGFTRKPEYFTDFLVGQGFFPIPDEEQNHPKEYTLYEPIKGIFPLLYHYPEYSQEESYPDWQANGHALVSLLNINFTLEPNGALEATRLAKEILRKYPTAVLFNPRTARFSSSSPSLTNNLLTNIPTDLLI